MRFIKTLFLSLSLLSLPVLAERWSHSEKDFVYTPGKMDFYNRSACAKKSLEPTRSVFLIIDNVNIAKSVYRLAKIRDLDTVATTNWGIEKFRYSLSSLIQITAAKILKGDLPLIKEEKLLKECEQGNCFGLDHYLETNWIKSGTISDAKQYSECKVIKKFSTLNSNLTVSKPDRTLFEEMAKEIQSQGEFTTSCDNFDDLSQPEVALYQFDLKDPKNFDEFGFDFWHSLKIYLSWAFRNSPEMKTLAEPFDYLFQSANLEEMVLFFSNGCQSIKPASCSEKDLSLDNLRYLTETTGALDWSKLESVRHVPDSSPLEQFSKPLPLLDEDILNLGEHASADEWVKNFRDNFVRTRGYNKIRLSRAVTNLSLITQNVSPGIVNEKVLKDISELNPESKQQLFYLCSEFSLAGDKDLSFIRKDLWRLKDLKIFDQVLKDLTESNLESFWKHFEELSSNINSLCQNLKQRSIWDEDFQLKKEGFSPWYQELVYEKSFNFTDDVTISSEKVSKPFLSIQKGNVICQDGIHCARLVLDSIMSLSAISHNLSALVPSSREVMSNNMANPYSSRMACGAYDPWAKRNTIIFDFFQDLAQTAVFGLLPTPVYVGATLDPKRVVSFDTLIKEGQVYYDPNFNTKRLKLALIADLGPLTGIPCSVSISGSRLNPFQYYMFNGISASTCKERTTTDVVVSSNSDVDSDKTYRQACATCAINLQTVASSASIINPIFRVSFFLIKGVVRLVSNLKDPHDLARDWSVSPNLVALSYRYQGEISKSCSKKLLKGKSCLEKSCEGEVLDELTSKYVISPTVSDFSCIRGKGYLEIKECDRPLHLKFGKKGTTVSTECTLKKRI